MKFLSKGYQNKTYEPTNNPKKNYKAKRKYKRNETITEPRSLHYKVK